MEKFLIGVGIVMALWGWAAMAREVISDRDAIMFDMMHCASKVQRQEGVPPRVAFQICKDGKR